MAPGVRPGIQAIKNFVSIEMRQNFFLSVPSVAPYRAPVFNSTCNPGLTPGATILSPA